MPRVREIEEPGKDPILKDVFAKDVQAAGALLNPTKVMAHTPGILRAAKQLTSAVAASGLLPAELLALVYLRVSRINGCPF